MASFILIPGAGGAAWYWHRVVPLLTGDHEALAVDLPADDETKGLDAYCELVIRAIGSRTDVVLVAQSLGGFTAPLVCARVRPQMLVFVNAMIPLPNETAGAWWENTRSEEARIAAAKAGGYTKDMDLETYFFHDVPKETLEGAPKERDEAKIAFTQPCRFERWPEIPIHVVVGKDDRFFPPAFQKRIARERLELGVDELPGGHLVALSQPKALAEQLLGYLR